MYNENKTEFAFCSLWLATVPLWISFLSEYISMRGGKLHSFQLRNVHVKGKKCVETKEGCDSKAPRNPKVPPNNVKSQKCHVNEARRHRKSCTFQSVTLKWSVSRWSSGMSCKIQHNLKYQNRYPSSSLRNGTFAICNVWQHYFVSVSMRKRHTRTSNFVRLLSICVNNDTVL